MSKLEYHVQGRCILRQLYGPFYFNAHCGSLVPKDSLIGIKFVVLYFHVTVHRNRFLFKYPTRRTNYPNLFCYKTLHVSGIFSAHHQEFSTVRSALVSYKQSPDAAWKRLSKTCMKLTSAERTVENS